MTKTKKMTEEYKKALRNHANRNISYLLDKLAVSYTDRGDGLIQAICPAIQHGGDRNNTSAFSWKTDIGRWVCWTHHCEESCGNDIFGLVSSVLGIGFKGAVEWINAQLDEKKIDVNVEVVESINVNRVSLYTHEPLQEKHITFLKLDPQYLLNRGFSREVLRDYQAGLWEKPGTHMHDRVIFPIRDHEGFLVGYTGRTIHSEQYFLDKGLEYRKWIHGRYFDRWCPRNSLRISSLLFNLNRAKLRLGNNKKMIVVEGPLDGMKLEMSGVHNWVATLGTTFSANHRTLLVKYGVTDLYAAYDNDESTKAGEDGERRLRRIVGDMFNVHKVNVPGHDCGDLSVSEIQSIFKGIGC